MPEPPRFDALKYKEATREQWQGAAEAWHRWIPVVRRWAGPVTDLMLDRARVSPGMRVLDVAAGDGDQSLMAAERVGPTGFVLATDIAPNLVALAARTARERGVVHLEARVMDAEHLPLDEGAFDVVVSRFGLFFLPDLPRALAEIRRVLKPGGRLGAIVFSTPDKNPFFSVPIAIIRRRAGLPAPPSGQPGPFSLGGPGVLATALTQAGFRDVQTECVSAPLRMASARECVRFERESFGALHHMLAGLTDGARDDAWQEIEHALERYEGGDGFESPCEVIVGGGVK
jgi:SAM-dependent methyltransferase